MYLSVIIPVLNEAERIDACLRRLADQPGLGECIVVDGGSADDTAARAARHHRVQVVHSRRGRAVQLNTGAAAARGDTLLFLHADTELPDNAAVTVAATLARPGVVAGGFRTWHRAERWRGKRRAALLHLADIRSRYSSLLYGDQAMFMTADIFRQVGGFPDLDLMEDLAMSKRLSGLGRVAVAPRSVRVSGRRFESAPLYQTALVNIFPLLYALGVSPRTLARLYGNPR